MLPRAQRPRSELAYQVGKKREIVFVCRAGCSQEAVIGALEAKGLWTNGEERARPQVVATFNYTATDGTPLRKIRWEPGFDGKHKSFSWEHLANGRWQRRMNGRTPRLYRYENIEAAGEDDPILITESERSADLLGKLGLFALSPGGSAAWKKEHAEGLAGHRVAILPDNDEPGRELAATITRSLAPICRVVTVDLPELPEGQGPDRWPHLNGSADQLRKIVAESFANGSPPLADGDKDQGRSRKSFSASADGLLGEWPEPKPLPNGLPPVEPFVPALLPAAFRVWVMDVDERMQCPPDFPAVAAMVGAGAVIGRQLAIRPKRRDDWTVVPNIWGAVVGRPSLMKSPALHETLMPLVAMEAEAAKRHREAVADWEAAQVVSRQAEKVNEAEIRKALKQKNHAAAHALAREDLDPGDQPARRRYVVNDTTVEKLGVILNENPNGVLIFRDELSGFLRAMDREGHEQDRAFYLEAWNGYGRYTYDRIGRGTLDIEACCVSILGGIQPGPLSDYLIGAVRQGAADDGLIQRFQLAVWPDAPAVWRNVDTWPDNAAKKQFAGAFQKLTALDAEAIKAECEGFLQFLRFDPGAQSLFDDWRAELERRLHGGEEHPAIEAHLAKYRSLVPSIALICHLVDGGVGPVPAEAMTRAVAWAEYLESHARRLYCSVTHSTGEAARHMAAKLIAGELPTPFACWQVWRPGWSGLSDRAIAQAAIDALVELDWLREESKPTSGRRKTLYRINPRVRGAAE